MSELWVNHEGTGPPVAERFVPAEDREYGWAKPKDKTGFWTSPPDSPGCWVRWMRDEGWVPGDKKLEDLTYWLLDPDPAARVYVIDSYAYLEALTATFPAPRQLDLHEHRASWEAIAREYDAVELTDAGQWATRLSSPCNLYGWDCESTLWLRWCFVGEPRQISPKDALDAISERDDEAA